MGLRPIARAVPASLVVAAAALGQEPNVGVSCGDCEPLVHPAPRPDQFRWLYAPSWCDDAGFRQSVSKVVGDDAVSGYMDLRCMTPTLDDLCGYDAIYTWCNEPYLDAPGFGNVLAEYVNRGGFLVLGLFTALDQEGLNGLAGAIMGPAHSPVAPSTAIMPAGTYAFDGFTCYHGASAGRISSPVRENLMFTQGDGVEDGTYEDGSIYFAYNPAGKVVYVSAGAADPVLDEDSDVPCDIAGAFLQFLERECDEDIVMGGTSPGPGGDGVVDVDDLVTVILEWGPCAAPDPPPLLPPCVADIDCDGSVDVDDLVAVILAWGDCPPTGACCFCDGHCRVMEPGDCLDRFGTYLGDGTTCADCPLPEGACCLAPRVCAVQTEQDCANAGGVYQGDDTICEIDTCPAYTLETCDSPFQDIADVGIEAPTASNGDDAGDVVPIGFTFSFFGDDHDQIGITSNGYLTFGATLGDFTNDPIPSAANPNDLIAPLWDDWSPNQAGTVHYLTKGPIGSRVFVAQWTGVPHFDAGGSNTFQAALFEGSNVIELRYFDVTITSPTVGIENQDGTDGVAVPTDDLGTCVRLTPF